MRQIDSRNFQIFRKDKYWRITYVKVSSRHYSSIYARMLENVTNIRYLPILGSTYVRFHISTNLEVPRMYLAHNDKYREYTNTLIRTLLVRLFSPYVLGYSMRINVCVVSPLQKLRFSTTKKFSTSMIQRVSDRST